MRAALRPRNTRTFARAAVALALGALIASCSTSPAPEPSVPTPTPSAPTTPAPTTPAPTSPAPTSSEPTTPAPTTPAPTSSEPTTPAPTTPSPTATDVPDWLVGEDVRRVPTSRKVVVLTFDGGGNAAGLARILDTLEAERVPGTFFLTGRWVQVYPRETQAIADAGHVIGNHTMTHLHSTAVADAVLLQEIRDAAATIRAATGVDPRPWFRFPYGERTAADVRLVNAHGYVCVSWGVDTLGWLGTSRGTAADVTARVVAALQPGLIVLMHVGANPDDGTTYDADSLSATITALRARGYAFTTVTDLLDPPQR